MIKDVQVAEQCSRFEVDYKSLPFFAAFFDQSGDGMVQSSLKTLSNNPNAWNVT